MALPTSIELVVITPERLLIREQVDEVVIPGSEGYFGVLPGHTPLLADLAIGEMWYRKGQEKTYLALAYGFVEVLPDRVTVLARIAEKADEIDLTRAEEALKRAKDRLQEYNKEIDYERARMALEKSIARIEVASRMPVGTGLRKKMRPPQG
jgi:F-type H+-transporting ATPase subunit epsilon